MTIEECFIVYPEGESQELDAPLKIDQLVDINGRVLVPPLASPRMIAYRVVKIRRLEERGMRSILHYVELVPAVELLTYCS
jgi:hypothetical protein